MRLLSRFFPRHFLPALLVCSLAFAGCNKNGGGAMGGSSASGDSADQGSQKQGGSQQKTGSGSQVESTEPQNSVTGQPSADSDRGSSNAVAHRSVAQPGAPEGTMSQDAGKNANPGTQSQPAKVSKPAPAPER